MHLTLRSCTFLLGLCLCLWWSPPARCNLTGNLVDDSVDRSADHSFKLVDPVSGAEVTCDQCPPGQFLKRGCTKTSPSQCETCPPGSFTAIWNHIDRCLRCGVCGRHMEEATECRPNMDCSCQCKRGFYYKERAGMCVRWSQCGTGTGATLTGTPHRNTECSPCTNGTFSDRVSSEAACSAHSVCQAPGSKVILRGSAWHDLICTASCEEARGQDSGHFLRGLLPSFFSHHSLSVRRLKHVLSKLPSADGRPKQRRSSSGLNEDQLRTRLDQWISQASPDQLRILPRVLKDTGAAYAGERLQHKLERIQQNLNLVCPESTTEPGLGQVQTTTEPGLNQN